MLLAFINPSGPTREPQELSVLVSDNRSHFRRRAYDGNHSPWLGALAARELQRRLCGNSSLTPGGLI